MYKVIKYPENHMRYIGSPENHMVIILRYIDSPENHMVIILRYIDSTSCKLIFSSASRKAAELF